MPVKKTVVADLIAEVSALLGQREGVSSGPVSVDALAKLTHRQLLDGARKLGLVGVARLKKEALAGLVWEAWLKLQLATGDHTGDTQESPFSHKFEVAQSGPETMDSGPHAAGPRQNEAANEIPWGYGHDRIAAMPVDPDRLYAYWEVLEGSIAKARESLGRGGAGAWLNLRVYDTTGRIFDGTNAHSTTDHRVERSDRQWFFAVGKPASEVIVEIGMKSHEGYFVKIARSGRVEFPRREPVPWTEPEWLTVRVATGQVERAGMRLHARATGAHAAGAHNGTVDGAAALDGNGVTVLSALSHTLVPTVALRHVPWADALRFGESILRESHMEWEEVHVDGTIEVHRQFNWVAPATITSWEAGPFPYPVEVPEPMRETFSGKTRVFRSGPRTHVVYGPWQVVIRGLGAQHSRAVLSRWEVYRSWAETTGHDVQTYEPGAGPVGASERRLMGASERRWMGASEVRMRGASEVFFLAASELRLRGASERLFLAASERRLRGASERLLAGASELRFRGASERRLGGASELRFGGASERMLAGASENRFLGSSENQHLGASELRLGGSPQGGGSYPAALGDGPPSGTSVGGSPSSTGTGRR